MQLVLLAAALGVALAGEQCCSTTSFQVNDKGALTSHECDMEPAELWASGVADRGGAWAAGSAPAPLWIAFAGDSELRLEFWQLVRMFGRVDRYRVTPNFASVGFNIDDPAAVRKANRDPDPVPIPAKWIDYTFCCESRANPESCLLKIGSSNTTKVVADAVRVVCGERAWADARSCR
jgi:hypothetical protein